EVKAVYVDDKLGLGLDAFLAEGDKRYVQTNILAVMLVAIDKGFWQADAATRKQLAAQFAGNIIEHGNPGSGHTHADHPMYDMVRAQLAPEQAAALDAALAKSRLAEAPPAETAPTHVQEVRLDAPSADAPGQAPDDAATATEPSAAEQPWLIALAAGLLLTGILRGRRAR
ncbi:MAG: hypothetical protein KDE64_10535, partial [Rhodocyclaceae bacterium]|nr:hypothetical protein [Rhodocyclaceae bacterium]